MEKERHREGKSASWKERQEIEKKKAREIRTEESSHLYKIFQKLWKFYCFYSDLSAFPCSISPLARIDFACSCSLGMKSHRPS